MMDAFTLRRSLSSSRTSSSAFEDIYPDGQGKGSSDDDDEKKLSSM
jgi:hypothetical protein